MTAKYQPETLLGPRDIAPVIRFNPLGRSPFLLVGDHAGVAIPVALGTLGLGSADLDRHIASDIGVRGLGESLAIALDAVFIHQAYSRLVIDCNRDPTSAEAVTRVSDGTEIPGNQNVTEKARRGRIAAIHAPYQAAIAAEIKQRTRAGGRLVLVSLHSFTPVMAGTSRPWDVSMLHDGANDRFAKALLHELRARVDSGAKFLRPPCWPPWRGMNDGIVFRFPPSAWPEPRRRRRFWSGSMLMPCETGCVPAARQARH